MEWPTLLLGLIALGSLLQAVVVIGLALGGLRLARRVQEVQGSVERELRPALDSLSHAAQNAGEVVSLANEQARRLEAMVASTVERMQEARGQVRDAVSRPFASIVDLAALVKGFRRGVSVYRRLGGLEEQARGGARRYRGDDDELFI
jgi:hypothetical protein